MKSLLGPVLALGMVSIAMAGIACPDPLSATVIDGECHIVTCFGRPDGYIPITHIVHDGGCQKTSRHSANKCIDANVIGTTIDGIPSGPEYSNPCGANVYPFCTPTSTSWGGASAYSSSQECNYCTGE